MDNIKESEKRAEELRADNELLDEELSKVQKKRAIKEAKAFYGKDFAKMIGGAVRGIGKLRVDSEAMHNLHGLGFGGKELRDRNDPKTWKGR